MKREQGNAAPSRPLWVLLTGIWLAPAHILMAQPVYKVTDTDGNVTFTDTPPLSSDSIVEEQPVHTPNSAKPTATTRTPPASVEVEVEVPTRYDTRIVTPAENATIPMGPGNFTVQAALSPRLASSETLQLLLDGEPVGAPQRTANWQLTNVYRGEHRLRVVRLDESGAPVDTSAASTVFVMRPIVKR